MRNILKMILLLFVFSLSAGDDESRAQLIGNGFITESLNNSLGLLTQMVDLRSINELHKKTGFESTQSLFNHYVDNEKKLDFMEKYQICHYIEKERERLEKDDFSWVFSDITSLRAHLSDSLADGDYTTIRFSSNVVYGGLCYYYSGVKNREESALFLKELIGDKTIIVGKEKEAARGGVIPLIDSISNETVLIIYAYKADKSLYSSLNGNYFISALFDPGNEVPIENYAEFKGINSEMELIFGFTDHYGLYKPGKKYRVIKEAIPLYKSPSLDSGVLLPLKKESVVSVSEIGERFSYRQYSVNWLKVSDESGTEGWVPGSILELYNVIEVSDDFFF